MPIQPYSQRKKEQPPSISNHTQFSHIHLFLYASVTKKKTTEPRTPNPRNAPTATPTTHPWQTHTQFSHTHLFLYASVTIGRKKKKKKKNPPERAQNPPTPTELCFDILQTKSQPKPQNPWESRFEERVIDTSANSAFAFNSVSLHLGHQWKTILSVIRWLHHPSLTVACTGWCHQKWCWIYCYLASISLTLSTNFCRREREKLGVGNDGEKEMGWESSNSVRRELQWEIDLEWRIREQLRDNKILVFFFFLLYNRDIVQFYLYNCTVAQLQFFL